MHKFNHLLLGIVFLAVLLAILIPSFPPVWAGKLSFISLVAVPLFLINGLLFLGLLWTRSQWKWVSALLILGSLPSMACHIALPHPFSHAKKNVDPLRLISWNAEGFQLNVDTLKAAAYYINEQVPDICCLQERPHNNLLPWDSLQAAFPQHPYRVINSREDEVLNLALFSKWQIMQTKEYYFTDSYNKILQADIQVGTQSIRLFNVHLQTTGLHSGISPCEVLPTWQHNAIWRNQQVDQLIQAIQESPFPVIVCGDFNDVPSSYAYHRVARLMQDCFLQAGRGWAGSYQPGGGTVRIDYMFCSKSMTVSQYNLTSTPWSDHKIQKSEIYTNDHLND